MLILEGYPYAATDVTQAFYLYQNHFWNFITGGNVVEEVETPGQLSSPEIGKPVHIPWWNFAELKPDQKMAFDVVTCNHTISEMHPNSLRYMLWLAQRAQSEVNSEPVSFVIDGFYHTSINPLENIMERFYCFGYILVHHDAKITIFAPAGTNSSLGGLSLPRKGRTLLDVPQDILRRFIGLPSLYKKRQWGVREYSSLENVISRSIRLGRRFFRQKELVPIERVNDFYTQLTGRRDHRNLDEKFLDSLINREVP